MENMKLYKILIGKIEGKRSFRRHSCRWEDNIGMSFKVVGWEVVDWIDLSQDNVAGTYEYGNEPSGSILGG
jgi:hypothetical protein